MPVKRLRKPELLLFALPLLIPVVYFGAAAVRHRFQYEVVSNVGQFATEKAEQQAVVKRLSMLLKEYPNATEFKVYGNHPQLRVNGTAFYTRKWKNTPRHWHGVNYGENSLILNQLKPSQLPVPKNPAKSYLWPFLGRGNVTDEDIHEVAKSSGVVMNIFLRASERYRRLKTGRKAEEKKLGVDIDDYGRHHPKGTLNR